MHLMIMILNTIKDECKTKWNLVSLTICAWWMKSRISSLKFACNLMGPFSSHKHTECTALKIQIFLINAKKHHFVKYSPKDFLPFGACHRLLTQQFEDHWTHLRPTVFKLKLTLFLMADKININHIQWQSFCTQLIFTQFILTLNLFLP